MVKNSTLYVRCDPNTKRKLKQLTLDFNARNLEETLKLLIEVYEEFKTEWETAKRVKMV
jgi:hypothetical protein